jgi:ferredoxin-NADP reductase
MDATVTVASVESVGPETIAVTFDAPAEFDASPGQFVRLTATVGGSEVSRFYTISSPDTSGSFETTVGLGGGDEDEASATDGDADDDANGDDASDAGDDPDFAAYLADREPGDAVEMSGPFGDQFYEREARAVVLAGGPGIGPAVAIAERALAAENEAAVVYRTDASMDAPAHRERLDALRERGASVTITDGPLADAVAAAVTSEAGEQAFVYGFADFVDEASAALADAGSDPDDAKVENFR